MPSVASTNERPNSPGVLISFEGLDGVGKTTQIGLVENALHAQGRETLRLREPGATRLGEAVPGDLVLWNKLMVMGVALGVSKKTLRELADAVPPAVRNAEGFYDYYPVYWWCYSDPALAAPTDSIGKVYHDSVSAVAASGSSSGGGGGGGFSGGGGGGCGGGGGGTF